LSIWVRASPRRLLTFSGVRRAARHPGSVAGQPPCVPTTFLSTLPLAGAAFTAMLQLSPECEGWPLGGTRRLRSGLAAFALSWVAGTGAYFLFVNFDAVSAVERAAAGLRNPGRPHRRTRLRLGAHRRRPLAGSVLHRPARLARQNDQPAPAMPAPRQRRPCRRPRRPDLPRASQRSRTGSGVTVRIWQCLEGEPWRCPRQERTRSTTPPPGSGPGLCYASKRATKTVRYQRVS
jgi:hypothetical protein